MTKSKTKVLTKDNYSILVNDLSGNLESARKASVHSVNSILTSAYWLVGKRIEEYELKGLDRSDYYGDRLIEKIAEDLSKNLGKGFIKSNVFLMKSFYLTYPDILRSLSGKSSDEITIHQTSSSKSLAYRNIFQTPSDKSLGRYYFSQTPSSISWTPYGNYFIQISEIQSRKLLMDGNTK
jgi:hypothetical protein